MSPGFSDAVAQHIIEKGEVMERRSFLGLLIAGAAAPLLPALAADAPPLANAQIWTAETLAVEMEKMFSCRMGPAMAFFEVTRDTGVDRHVYETYGFAVEGGEAWEAEHRLASHFYEQFSQVENKNLVWRRKPRFETEEVTEYGDTWRTSEEIEDRKYQVEEYVDLNGRTRSRYLPERTLEVPEGVELDFLTGNYRHVTRKYPLHRMTMRLVFTDDLATSTFARAEGMPLPRI